MLDTCGRESRRPEPGRGRPAMLPCTLAVASLIVTLLACGAGDAPPAASSALPPTRGSAGAATATASSTPAAPAAALDSLPPGALVEQMLTFDYPPGDTALDCVPLDPVLPVNPNDVNAKLRDGERWRCSLAAGEDVTIVLAVDSMEGGLTYIKDLRALYADGSTQDLGGAGAEPPPRGEAFLHTIDLDFDGTRELGLLEWWGATGNEGWQYWRWQSATHRLVDDTVLTNLGNPEPLAGTHCLRTHGVGGMAGMIHSMEVGCWQGGRLVTVGAENQSWNDTIHAFLRYLSTRRPGAGALTLLRIDTVRDSLWKQP